MIVEIKFRNKKNVSIEEWAKGLLESTNIRQPKRKSSTKNKKRRARVGE